MKEFVEKLIERLEESEERYDDVSFAQLNEFGHTLDYEYAKGKRDGMAESKEIVKDLESEHNNDFCEWEDTESLRKKGVCYGSDGLYKPSCNDDEDDFMDWNCIRHFEFCPYCGKEIRVVN